MAIPAGLEPATRGVEIRYSNFVQDSATDDPNGSIDQNPGYKLRCELGYIDFIEARKDK